MTIADPTASLESQSRWERFESILVRLSEWFNPILVKEARQALKSRQFLITFTLLLICGWGWSLLGLAMILSGSYSMSAGAHMLSGYYAILAFPLFVIVPFTAFRSLAMEREDRTYELLSITTLRPRQIIGGKLGTAVLQMIVYFSALAPCIAFTYLLRGIDIVSIVFLLAYTFYVSVLLSVAGLFLATVAKARHWQVVMSVAIILGLTWLYFGAVSITSMQLTMMGSLIYDNSDFWTAHAMAVISLGSYGVLVFYAAAAAISFASDNRATRLRVVLAIQQFILIGLTTYLWIQIEESEILAVGLTLAGIHWAIIGAMMTGESPQISQRVSRNLPHTVMGRLYLSLFTPGPATGYLFVIANMLTIVATFAGLIAVVEVFDVGTVNQANWILLFGFLFWCYIATYLGIGKLVMDGMRRANRTGPQLGLLVNLLLVLIASLGVTTIQWSFYDYRYQETYTMLQIANPFWTLGEFVDNGWRNTILTQTQPAALILGATSVLAIYFNLIANARQIRRQRQATPQRVLEDEAELHPRRVEQPKAARSPWDE